jgi:hypothetical protein
MPRRPSSSAISACQPKDLPGIDELKAAGLLDPVDDAYEDDGAAPCAEQVDDEATTGCRE